MSKEELKDCTYKELTEIIKDDKMPQDFIFKFYKVPDNYDLDLLDPTGDEVELIPYNISTISSGAGIKQILEFWLKKKSKN